MLLKSIDTHKAPGNDNLPNAILKIGAYPLSYPIYRIFSQSLSGGYVPNIWKKADIIPIHKGGDKSKVTNYRPISLLPTLSKILERLVYRHIFDHVSPVLSPFQHGFYPKRSCLTNLASLLPHAYSAIENKSQLDIIYTDFSKAFDIVPHHISHTYTF